MQTRKNPLDTHMRVPIVGRVVSQPQGGNRATILACPPLLTGLQSYTTSVSAALVASSATQGIGTDQPPLRESNEDKRSARRTTKNTGKGGGVTEELKSGERPFRLGY